MTHSETNELSAQTQEQKSIYAFTTVVAAVVPRKKSRSIKQIRNEIAKAVNAGDTKKQLQLMDKLRILKQQKKRKAAAKKKTVLVEGMIDKNIRIRNEFKF
jgi:hypothetical protein